MATKRCFLWSFIFFVSSYSPAFSTPKRIVISGGPGTGKTMLVLALEILHNEYVVREAASDAIALEQALGNKKPWLIGEVFEKKIINLQKQRNRNIPPHVDRVIFDRGYPDSLAFIDHFPNLHEELKQFASQPENKYDLVFIAEPLDFTDTNEIRKENREEALELCHKIEAKYRSLGYEPVIIKNGPVEERLAQVLEELRQLQ